jgi:hypothetical protein
LELLRLETLTFSDVTLSDINVVLCYVLSQYREMLNGISIINLCCCVEEAEAQTRVPREDLMCEENEEENTHICLPRSGHENNRRWSRAESIKRFIEGQKQGADPLSPSSTCSEDR